MAIEYSITKLAEKVRNLKPLMNSEAATKSIFISTFISDVLGYDIRDPREVTPDFPIALGEKADFAIRSGDDLRVLINCMKINDSLLPEKAQELMHLMQKGNADYGILSNGEHFEVYAGSSLAFSFVLNAVDSHTISQIRNLSKATYDPGVAARVEAPPTPAPTTTVVHNDMPWSSPERPVAPDEVFFSTTDSRGVIEDANEVFVELSHYTRPELIGAPHNIVRHEGMPASVFHAMWAALQNDIPFASYVRNRTKQGTAYDVFATVTKLENGGYLSVRIAPCVAEQWAVTQGIYDELSEYEGELVATGVNRRNAAERGAHRLNQILGGLGFSSYEQLQWAQLPEEVRTREALAGGLPQRPHAFGNLKNLLTLTSATYEELDKWMAEQDEILDLARSLEAADERLNQEIQAAVEVSDKMDALDITGPERDVLLIPLRIWMNMHGLANSYLEELKEILPKLADAGAKARFQIALSRLHTTMVGVFTAELIDGKPNSAKSAPAIHMLCSALRQTLHDMDNQDYEYRRLKTRVSGRIRSVKSIMEVPRALIADWTLEAKKRNFTPAVAELVATVSASVDGASTSIAELQSLIARLESGEVHDTTAIRQYVERIDAEAMQYQDTLLG
jgi:hypothetical protein